MSLTKSETYSKSAVAAEQPLASKAGFDAIKAGGNAFDAAAAVAFTLSVVLPQTSGLGGDFFVLFKEGKTGKVRCLNGSGWSPSGFSVERLRKLGEKSVPSFGPRSAVIPGMVLAVHELHRKFGRLDFGPLVEGAAKLARDGFGITPALVRSLNNNAEASKALMGGRQASAGDVLKMPRLAKTLGTIAKDGPDGFYKGPVARGIADAMASGGIETEESDFADMRPEWVEPIEATYRGRRVYEVPPNSIGAETLLILKQLEELDPSPPNSARRIREVTDATKVAWSAKDEMLGDPRFVGFDLAKFLSYRTPKLDGMRSDGDTTYFAVADDEGNLLSCIQSIFHPFGSRVFTDGGFVLSNRASAFRFEGPNKAEPRKRPVHTLSAMLVSDGEAPTVAMGASAAELRPQLYALFVTNLVDHSMGLEGALAYPRFAWNGSATQIEPGYETAGVREKLVESNRIGVAQGMESVPGSKKAFCDSRGDGAPAGE